MKNFLSLAITIGAANASEQLAKVFTRSCGADDFGSYDACQGENEPAAQCCKFKMARNPETVAMFCVSDERRGDLYSGKVTDFDHTKWTWHCQPPPGYVEDDLSKYEELAEWEKEGYTEE